MRVQCCVCKKVHANGAWQESAETSKPAKVSHTYCPSCLDEAMQDIRAERTTALITAQARLSNAAY